MSQQLIRNTFTVQECEAISPSIYAIISSESKLTPRSLSWIKKRLRKSECYVSFENNSISGFVFGVSIGSNFVEINSWYISPENRKGGLGDSLFTALIKDTTRNYFGNTYEQSLVDYFKSKGFRVLRFWSLGIVFLLLYIFSRKLQTILMFLAKRKPVTFLVKLAQ